MTKIKQNSPILIKSIEKNKTDKIIVGHGLCISTGSNRNNQNEMRKPKTFQVLMDSGSDAHLLFLKESKKILSYQLKND